MPKRTTLVLNDEVYQKLVRESMNRYGSARRLSKVVNDLIEDRAAKIDIRELIYSRKVARTSAREFERFRRRLSARLEH
jgi:predicted CopG family antitoxin